jgi:hypothetical protein
MDVIKKGVSALFMLIIIAACGKCFAQSKPGNQRVQFYFDKPITLDSLTKYVHSHSKIRFSFNSSKVKGSKLINVKKGTYDIELLLQQIQKNTSLYYSMFNGYVIFQDNPPKQRTTAAPAAPKKKPQPPVRRQATVVQRKPVPVPNNKPGTRQSATAIKPEPVAKTSPDKTNTIAIAATVDSLSQRAATIDTVRRPVAILPADSTVVFNGLFTLGRGLGIVPVDSTVITNDSASPGKAPAERAVTPTGTKRKERSTITWRRRNNTGIFQKTDWRWQYGLQWKAPLPLYGSRSYSTGTNTRSEPYNLLVPGIWLSTVLNDKHEIMLLVKPAEWYFYNQKTFNIDSGFYNRGFDTIPSRTNTSLVKTGGLYGSVQYNYHINEHWTVGAGVGYHLRGRGLARQKTYYRDFSGLITDSLYSMKSDRETNKYLASSFLSAKLETGYRFGALELGTTLLVPITAPFTSISLNKSRPVNLQLFLRWRINYRDDE